MALATRAKLLLKPLSLQYRGSPHMLSLPLPNVLIGFFVIQLTIILLIYHLGMTIIVIAPMTLANKTHLITTPKVIDLLKPIISITSTTPYEHGSVHILVIIINIAVINSGQGE